MPIKFPKGFTRRKSSGNALEEAETPPEPSFRVFERPGAGNKAFDGGQALRRLSQGRPLSSSDPDPHNIFAGVKTPLPKNRGSGGTHQSTSTGLYDSSSSSARLSSSSTLPSSTDGPVYNESANPHSRTVHDTVAPVPAPPPVFSLRAAGRTFSFGTRAPKISTPPQPPASPPITRDGATTASTTSTATPPKLLDADLDLDNRDEGFGSIFDGIGKRRSALLRTDPPPPNMSSRVRTANPSDPSSMAATNAQQESDAPPVPSKAAANKNSLPSINTDRSKHVEPGPYSWDSRNSQDGLMSSPIQDGGKSRALQPSSMMPSPPSPGFSRSPPNRGNGLRKSAVYPDRRSSLEDEDARLVLDSIAASRSLQPPPVPPHQPQENGEKETSSMFDSDDTEVPHGTGVDSTPKARKSASWARMPESESHNSLVASARLAVQYEQGESTAVKPQNKVMTPAQFERYRQQQELTRSKSNASESQASDDDDAYDEDDEVERRRETAKQRKKQEAHLSVYRQQMMKVTGEVPSSASMVAGSTTERASMSTPNLVNRMSLLGFGSSQGPESEKGSDAEDDEDVPLGILAAHGFPNKNRPPAHLASSSSNPNLRASVQPYPAPPGSVSGDGAGAGHRGSLPVFARHLPQDPYFGASLVTPANRESLAMGAGSVHGGASPGVHPGGLVGVIATEERARAMRRGSPNTQGGYGVPGTPGVGMPLPPNMRAQSMVAQHPPSFPPPQPQMSSGDQAQIQMSQQMTQMMQVQMQWMQQMMQMQGMPPAGQAPQPPSTNQNNFLSPVPPNMRPMSMASTGSFNNMRISPQTDQQTLDMLDPNSMALWENNRPMSFVPPFAMDNRNGSPGPNPGQGYTPSIAPSERSNVGMASRYRPVSTIQPDQGQPNGAGVRSSTFTGATPKPWAENHRNSSLSSLTPPPKGLHGSTSPSTLTVRPVSSGPALAPAKQPHRLSAQLLDDDEDEDQGWAEMMAKKQKKKSSWKAKKGISDLGDLFHHTAV